MAKYLVAQNLFVYDTYQAALDAAKKLEATNFGQQSHYAVASVICTTILTGTVNVVVEPNP
jgi:hypothetical protein